VKTLKRVSIHFNCCAKHIIYLQQIFTTFKISFNWYSGGGDQLGALSTAAINRPIVPAPGDDDDGEIDGMIGRGNLSTRRKPAPLPLCPPQTPRAARMRTRAAAVGSQRLTA
jgi:hypothetical protein